jgi:MFS family permease
MPRAFWALWVVQLVSALGFGAILPTLPLYLLSRGVALTSLGWMVGGYSLMAFVAQLVVGRYSDHLGRRGLLGLGLTVSALAMLGFLLPGSALGYLLLRALWGIGSGAVAPLAMAAAADLVPDERRGRAYGYLTTASTSGTAAGPLVGALVSRFSLTAPFLVGVPANIIAALLIWRMLPHSGPGISPSTGSVAPGRARLDLRQWWVPLTISFAWTGIFGMYDTTWSVFLRHLGASPSVIALSWTLFSLPLLIFSFLGGHLADQARGHRRPVVVGGLLLLAMMLITYSLLHSYVWVIAVSVVEALAYGVLGPSYQSLIMEQAPPHQRGEAQGVVQGAGTLGQLLMALAAGYLLPVSVRYPFRLGALVILLAAVVAGLWRHEWAHEAARSGGP